MFFAYSGFLYLLKWNPFWKWVPSLGFESRNNAEGFLILLSTIVWLIATFRIAFRGLRFCALRAASDGLENRKEDNRSSFSLKNIAIFHYFFYFFSRK